MNLNVKSRIKYTLILASIVCNAFIYAASETNYFDYRFYQTKQYLPTYSEGLAVTLDPKSRYLNLDLTQQTSLNQSINQNQVIEMDSRNRYSCIINKNTGVSCFEQLYNKKVRKINISEKFKKVKNLGINKFEFCGINTENKIYCENHEPSLKEFVGYNKDYNTNGRDELNNVVDLAAGTTHACAIDSKEGVLCWGNELHRSKILDVPEKITNALSIVAGYNHTCVLDKTEGIVCWGGEELSDVTNVPDKIKHPISLYAGNFHNCAIDKVEGLVCWGENFSGQLDVPANIKNPIQYSGGSLQSCVIDEIEGLVCWGNSAKRLIPIFAKGLTNVPNEITRPLFVHASDVQTCAVDSVLGFTCWGELSPKYNEAVLINTIAKEITVSTTGSCLIDENKRVTCWGDIATAEKYDLIKKLKNVTSISIGEYHACAIDDLEGLVCWGNNQHGQSNSPSKIKNPIMVSTGLVHTCVIDKVEGLFCWGSNNLEQISFPDKVKNPIQISSGEASNCVIDKKIGLWCWGHFLDKGQLIRNKSWEHIESPESVSVGDHGVCVIDNNIGLWCWGTQVGLGNHSVPFHIRDAVSVSVGRDHNACTITRKNELICWDWKGRHRGDIRNLKIPIQIQTPISVSVGKEHACAIDAAFGHHCWLLNDESQNKLPPTMPMINGKLVDDIIVGKNVSCANELENGLFCWRNLSGQVPVKNSLNLKSFDINYQDQMCKIDEYGELSCTDFSNDKLTVDIPSQIKDSKFKIVSKGKDFTCVITDKNKLWCFSDTKKVNDPYKVEDKSAFNVTAGESHACKISNFIKDHNLITCWGDNTFKQTYVPGQPHVMPLKVSAGQNHTCALYLSKVVFCWGDNRFNQLDVPKNLNSVTKFSSGGNHNCAIDDKEGVVCWGDNTYGQLNAPKNLLKQPIRISAGVSRTCAVDRTNGLICWGEDLIDQHRYHKSVSTYLGSLKSKIRYPISAHEFTIGNTTCYLSNNNNLKCYTENNYSTIQLNAQLTSNNFQKLCARVNTIGDICWDNKSKSVELELDNNYKNKNQLQVSAGNFHNCSINNLNDLNCWGSNNFGQADVPGSHQKAQTVSVSDFHTCAINLEQQLNCWGKEEYDALAIPDSIQQAIMVSTSNQFNCAIDESNGVICWGDNSYGQINTPKDLKSPILVSTGLAHACAIDKNKKLFCWGDNTFKQSEVPTEITSPIMVANGYFHTCAIDEVKGVVCWGKFSSYKLNYFKKFENPQYLFVREDGKTTCVLDEKLGLECDNEKSPQVSSSDMLLLPTSKSYLKLLDKVIYNSPIIYSYITSAVKNSIEKSFSNIAYGYCNQYEENHCSEMFFANEMFYSIITRVDTSYFKDKIIPTYNKNQTVHKINSLNLSRENNWGFENHSKTRTVRFLLNLQIEYIKLLNQLEAVSETHTNDYTIHLAMTTSSYDGTPSSDVRIMESLDQFKDIEKLLIDAYFNEESLQLIKDLILETNIHIKGIVNAI